MKIILKIQRYNHDTEFKPVYKEYTVEVEPTERILDALISIKHFQDGSLSFRKSCAHGVCGSDAMRINGKERLACKTLVRNVVQGEGETVLVEPLRNFPVLRDLIIDQSTFFGKYRSVKPFLINETPVKEKERLQSPEDRMLFDDTTNCILCSACYSACPVVTDNQDFLGPAAVVQAYRFLGDSRDKGFEERLPLLDNPGGVWPCQNHFECTRQCPRSIKITRRINQTKNMIKEYRENHGEKINDD